MHKTDPGKIRDSQAFRDPGYRGYICTVWVLVGFTGALSLVPYFRGIAREPIFIYTITIRLWWYGLVSYAFGIYKNLVYAVVRGTKYILIFFVMLVLEVVTWITRGVTFGARFLVRITLGYIGRYFLSRVIVDRSVQISIIFGSLSIF